MTIDISIYFRYDEHVEHDYDYTTYEEDYDDTAELDRKPVMILASRMSNVISVMKFYAMPIVLKFWFYRYDYALLK